MTLVTGSLVYFVIWWLILFTVLPWGARRPEKPQPGQDLSAPEHPRLRIKFLLTTLIAGIVWSGLWFFLSET